MAPCLPPSFFSASSKFYQISHSCIIIFFRLLFLCDTISYFISNVDIFILPSSAWIELTILNIFRSYTIILFIFLSFNLCLFFFSSSIILHVSFLKSFVAANCFTTATSNFTPTQSFALNSISFKFLFFSPSSVSFLSYFYSFYSVFSLPVILNLFFFNH